MDFAISYTDKEVTPWGGMVFLRRMLDQIEFGKKIEECEALPQPGSNRGYSTQSIIESFLVSVWCGASRFLHTEVTRHDNALTKIFGWTKAPGQDTYKRFFGKFTQATNQKVADHFYGWLFQQLHFKNITLDFDSSIITRYGQQEGAKRGYNPVKHGRASHHPLMAFVADVKMVANFWLRSGDAHTANNFKGFLEDTLQKLEGKTIGLVRLDSGFYDKEVFDYLEKPARPINYIVAARFYSPIQQMLASQKNWLKVDKGIEIAECEYQSPLWKSPRRMIMVRQLVSTRPQAAGKTLKLFKDEQIYNQYRYSCYITNLTLPPAEVWRLYRLRGDAENRIKELKYDFGLDSFNLKSFFGTEAALTFAMIAFNLMALFRQFLLNTKIQHRLSTLRFKTFAIGAYFVKEADQVTLKLALNLKRREWFTGLWDASKQFSLPVSFSNA